jgi:hypothetical protein
LLKINRGGEIVGKVMAIYASDAIYATRMMEFLKKRTDMDFEVAVFTKTESLEAYSGMGKIEILLLADEISDSDRKEYNSKYIYQLLEDPKQHSVKDIPGIFKYQSAQKILEEVILDYNQKEMNIEGVQNRKYANMIAVVPVIGTRSKLSFAWSLAFLLSERKKVLLIVLDLLPVSVLSEEDVPVHALSELIYYIKENNPSIILKMKDLIKTHGKLSSLTGLTHGWDLLSVTREDMNKWMEALKLHTDFDTVVFYLGYYADSMQEVLCQSNTVFISNQEDSYEKKTVTEWERQMQLAGISLEQPKFIRFFMQQEVCPAQDAFSEQTLKNSEAWLCAKQYAKEL